MTANEARHELRRLMDRFPSSSRSDAVRRELSDTIAAVYVAGHIERDEYHSLMQEVR